MAKFILIVLIILDEEPPIKSFEYSGCLARNKVDCSNTNLQVNISYDNDISEDYVFGRNGKFISMEDETEKRNTENTTTSVDHSQINNPNDQSLPGDQKKSYSN